MNVTKDMFDEFTDTALEPSDSEVMRYSEPIKRFFVDKKGFKDNELVSAIVPLIARSRMFMVKPELYSDPKKGVAILGNVGTGKTMLLKLAANALDSSFYDVPSLAVIFSRYGADRFWSEVEQKSRREFLLIDDLGAEPDARNFGNSVPICEFIYDRYNAWKNAGTKLWLTSNLTGEQLATRYGDRVVDRIKEMCEIVAAPGESLRK